MSRLDKQISPMPSAEAAHLPCNSRIGRGDRNGSPCLLLLEFPSQAGDAMDAAILDDRPTVYIVYC